MYDRKRSREIITFKNGLEHIAQLNYLHFFIFTFYMKDQRASRIASTILWNYESKSTSAVKKHVKKVKKHVNLSYSSQAHDVLNH